MCISSHFLLWMYVLYGYVFIFVSMCTRPYSSRGHRTPMTSIAVFHFLKSGSLTESEAWDCIRFWLGWLAIQPLWSSCLSSPCIRITDVLPLSPFLNVGDELRYMSVHQFLLSIAVSQAPLKFQCFTANDHKLKKFVIGHGDTCL